MLTAHLALSLSPSELIVIGEEEEALGESMFRKRKQEGGGATHDLYH